MRRIRAWTLGAARGGALFLTGLIAFNLLGELVREHFDANAWWLGLGARGSLPASVAIGLSGALLGAWAVRPRAGELRRALTVGALAALLTLALIDTVGVIVLRARAEVDTGGLPPFSALVALGLTAILAQVARLPVRHAVPVEGAPDAPSAAPPRATDGASPARSSGSLVAAALAALLCVVAFPCAQMLCFGRCDFRRPADVAVVFGCRAHADGRPSDALEDRVRTACELYHQDLVERLIVSGGPGDGDVHETEAMRRLAVSLGVPADAILVDAQGTNTQATVDGTSRMLRELGCRRVLAVSHDYHLPRIKLAYLRAGLDVWTVPARETRELAHKPRYWAREVLACWYYFVRPLGE